MQALGDWEGLPERKGASAEVVSGRARNRPMPGDRITARLEGTLAELEELLARLE
jgi:hypothetical protein